jgi:hypothetical protein
VRIRIQPFVIWHDPFIGRLVQNFVTRPWTTVLKVSAFDRVATAVAKTNGIHKNIGWHTLGTLLKANDRSPIPNF